MPPRYLRQPYPTRLKHCSEFMVEACDEVPADGCCGVLPCKLCLEFEVYGEESQAGSADFADNMWTGTVAGATFVSYWERNEYGVCEYIVEIDGEEVYREHCGNGASCRDPSGSISITIGYDEGILTWSKYEPRELKPITDPDTGCTTFFCGNCRCSCRTMCIDVSEVLPYGYGEDDSTDTYSGELPDVSTDDCDPPVWEGTVGSYFFSLTLGRDDYGNCILTPIIDDVELEPVAVTGCKDMTATFELEDGSAFTVRCKQCNCATVIGDCICGRPLGPTLRLLWSSANGTHGDAPREFPLTYGMTTAPGIVCDPHPIGGPFPAYTGSASGAFPIPMGGTRSDTLYVMMVCCIGCPDCVYYRFQSNMSVGDNTWYLTHIDDQDCECPAILTVGDFQTANDYQISDIVIMEREEDC